MKRQLMWAGLAGLGVLGCAGHRITPVYVSTPAVAQLSLARVPHGRPAIRIPSPFDVLYRDGRYGDAIEMFEADRRLHTDPSALLRMALLHADPAGERYDPQRASGFLREILDLQADGERQAVATVLLGLIERLEGARARTGSLERQLEELKAIDLEDPP